MYYEGVINMKKLDCNRRSFFKMALSAIAVIPVLSATKLQAASCPGSTAPAGKKLAAEGKGMAKGLDYVATAGDSKNPKYVKGQDCGNCKYFNDKKLETGYAPCTMLGMSYVPTCGWCKSYLKK